MGQCEATQRWSDSDGHDVYGDFKIDDGNGDTIRSFERGVGRVTSGVSEGDAAK